ATRPASASRATASAVANAGSCSVTWSIFTRFGSPGFQQLNWWGFWQQLTTSLPHHRGFCARFKITVATASMPTRTWLRASTQIVRARMTTASDVSPGVWSAEDCADRARSIFDLHDLGSERLCE